jgi:hypothetical protein
MEIVKLRGLALQEKTWSDMQTSFPAEKGSVPMVERVWDV